MTHTQDPHVWQKSRHIAITAGWISMHLTRTNPAFLSLLIPSHSVRSQLRFFPRRSSSPTAASLPASDPTNSAARGASWPIRWDTSSWWIPTITGSAFSIHSASSFKSWRFRSSWIIRCRSIICHRSAYFSSLSAASCTITTA